MTHEELLKTIEEYHQKTDDNVLGVGYGYKTAKGLLTDEISVVFTVKEKLPKEQLTKEQLLPKEIELNNKLISTDVVQGTFKLFCDPTFYNWMNTGYTVPNKGTFRPLIGGISSSNFTSMSGSTGTLGFFAIDNDTNSLVGVSNNHVYINDAFICSERNPDALTGITNVKGDVVSQRHEYLNDNFPIGVVKKYYPIRENGFNYIDASVTTIYSGNTYINSGTSFNQEGLTASTYPFASTSEIDNLLVSNPLLYSAGRTTGAKGEGTTKLRIYQFPIVASVAYNRQGTDVVIDYTDLIAFVATTGSTQPFDICSYPIWHGDSGSALIADLSGTKKIIGLCFAGTLNEGVACRIDRVASLLNLSAWNGESVNFSDNNNIMEHTINGLSDLEYVDIEGKRYWQVGLRNITNNLFVVDDYVENYFE